MKVLIPSAGIGSRLGEMTSHYNKAMVPIGSRPVISYIVDQYPQETEFIVALGYKGDYIRQYLELAYPRTKFELVGIDNFYGPGSGLGYTLKQCKPYLDQEFIFHANDSIVFDKSLGPPLETDTMFLCKDQPDPKKYRTVSVNPETLKVEEVHDKTEVPLLNVFNYIGVSFIKNYQEFIDFLDDISVTIGESDYFMRKQGGESQAHFVDTWYDIGNIEQIRSASSKLVDFHNLQKADEAIYFKGTKVFKFFTDENIVQKRVERAGLLNGMVPDIIDKTRNFYVYNYVPGKVLSDEVSVLPDFRRLLDWSKRRLWSPLELNQEDQSRFESSCFSFYYEKTMDRLDSFYALYDFEDKEELINGVQTPSLSAILEMLDWADLGRGIPVLFHGDYHFENVLKTEDGFKLLDWRQGFGNEIRYGDLYYDLAKLLHGLIVNHPIIRAEQFVIHIAESEVTFDFHRKQSLLECEKTLEEFIKQNGWSWNKTQVLTSLIYLNIASLHHYPYSHFLYYLGKTTLLQTAKNNPPMQVVRNIQGDNPSS